MTDDLDWIRPQVPLVEGRVIGYCTCGHRKMNHRYLAIIGENSGDCLILTCECTIYKDLHEED